MIAILAKKIGMTSYLYPDGRFVSATALEAGPCVITDVKSPEKHGYKAAQIGFGAVKDKHITKADKMNFTKKKIEPKKWLREIRLSAEENYELGQEIKVDVFKAGDAVDVQGTSIGKGFAGGMKKWHWGGGPNSHGSMFHRHIGSVGASSFPSRTWPGQKMPGRMGGVTQTVQNLEVLKVDVERNLLLVKGPVPGGDNGLLFVRKALKLPKGYTAKIEEKKAEKKKDAGKKKEEKPKK